MLRKFPASNALAAIFRNLELFKKYKNWLYFSIFSYLRLFSVFIINGSTILC